MTISSATNKSGPYTENGVTTNFAYEFKIEDETHVKVVRAASGVETVLTLTTDYTVTGVGGNGGGNVVINTPVSGSTLTLVLDVPFTQEVDLQNQGAFFAEVVEAALDLAAQRDKQLQEQIDRAVVVPVSAGVTDLDALVAGILTLEPIAADITTVAGISGNVTTVAGIAGNVTTVAGIAANVTTVAGISANVTAVAGNATNINAVAGNAPNINAVAANASNINAVATNATNVNTVATNIASINSAASNMAAIIAAPTEAANAAQSAIDAAASAASVDAATIVHVTPDTFSEAQKGQARANIDAGILAGFRNKIINGDFDVNQRGSVTGNTFARWFGPDRWNMNAGGTGTPSLQMSQQPNADSSIPGSPEFMGRFSSNTTGAFSAVLLEHRIENVRTLSGKKATLTFYAKSSPAFASGFTVAMYQNFGSGGSATVTALASQSIALTGSFQKFQFVIDIPSVAGKTIGAGNYLHLVINFPLSAVTLDLSRVSLVEGDASAEADPFSPRQIQQELALCQRYYEAGQGQRGYNPTGSAALTVSSHNFMVEKRAIPTVTVQTGLAQYVTVRGFRSYQDLVPALSDYNPGVITAEAEL